MRRFTKVWLFEALFLLMTAAMNGVVLAGDLFNLFVFLEVAAIASYALVAFGCESEELEAAFKYLILGTVGSAFILLGVTVLYSLTGHLNMARIAELLPAAGAGGPATLLAAAAIITGTRLTTVTRTSGVGSASAGDAFASTATAHSVAAPLLGIPVCVP